MIGGAGDDVLTNNVSTVTLNAGDGDDIVNLGFYTYPSGAILRTFSEIVQYAEGDGDDTIFNYGTEDTLHITSGEIISALSYGNDVVVSVEGGSVTLKDAADRTIKAKLADGTLTTLDVKPAVVDLIDVVLTNKDASIYSAESNVRNIDASARTKVTNITANANDNIITGGSKVDTIDADEGNDTLSGNGGADILNGGAGDDLLDGGAGADKLNGDAGDDLLDGGAGADKLDGGAGNDTLQGGKAADTLTGGTGADTFIYTDGDGKDIITDYSAGEDIIKLAGGNLNKVSVKGSDVALVVGSGSIKLSNGKGKKITIIDSSGYTSSQTYGEKSISIADGDGQTIDTSLNTVAVTLNASGRMEDLTLIGNTKANVIQLGSGSSTVNSGNGKDTIIANENGQALIKDYVAGQDKLKFNVDITEAVESGSDIIFTLGTGKVTVAGGKGKKITVIDKDNKTQYIDISTNVKLTNSDFADYKALNSAISIDASKRTKAINIVGNAKDNSIIGGKGKDTINGGEGADTLTGGKGNDTLTGGTGADVFYYTSGDGNDVITDYSASEGDLIHLGKNTTIKKAAFSGNDLVLSIGNGKITIKNGADQTVTVVDDDDMETTYKKRSRAVGFTERWFLEGDDNFTSSDVSTLLNTDSNINAEYSLKSELKLNQIADTISLTSNLAKNK